MIRFFEPCVPPTSTAQTKRFNHKTGSVFKDKRHEAAISLYDSILLKHQPQAVMEGPTHITIEMTWPYRKSESKKVKELERVPHTSRPDLDNLAKGLVDRLVALRFIADDGQVSELVLRKFWGKEPGIKIQIEVVTP